MQAGAPKPGSADLAAMLARVGIDAPEERLSQYPHRLSGGQRQRVMIAAAIAHRPALLIADTVTLPIQINGKRRAEISVPVDMPVSEIEKLALADQDVVKFLAGQPIKKIIVVPGRIINVVV